VGHRGGRPPGGARQAARWADWLDGFHTWHQNSPRYKTDIAALDPALSPLGAQDWRTGTLVRAVAARLRGDGSSALVLEDQTIGATGLGTSAVRLAEHLGAASMLKTWLGEHLGWTAPKTDTPKTDTPKTDTPKNEQAAWPEIKAHGLGTSAARTVGVPSGFKDSAPTPSSGRTVTPVAGAPTDRAHAVFGQKGEAPAPLPDVSATSWSEPRPTGIGTSAVHVGAPPVDLPPQCPPIQ
jgi:hypothetical protein